MHCRTSKYNIKFNTVSKQAIYIGDYYCSLFFSLRIFEYLPYNISYRITGVNNICLISISIKIFLNQFYVHVHVLGNVYVYLSMHWCVHAFVCLSVCICTYLYVCLLYNMHIYILYHIDIHIYLYMCVAHIYFCMHTYMHIRLSSYFSVNLCIYLSVCVYTYQPTFLLSFLPSS